jgi:aquaporin Z
MQAKLVTEFIGTFFLVLTIGLTVLIGTEFAPIAIGGILIAAVFMGGHVSGAHYNPAITLAVWLGGKMDVRDVAPYMGAQILGGLTAAFVVAFVQGDVLQVQPATDAALGGTLILEFLFALMLCAVVLNVAYADDTAGNSYFGLAIGITVMAGAFAAGPISGGAFNPAVAIGPVIVDLIMGDGASTNSLWIYLVATLAGGAAAAAVFHAQHPVTRPPVAPQPE